ncbi:MAG: FAD-binding protein, partial [Brachybacterium tyrofermentans]
MRLSDLTTLRIGGEISNLIEARTADEVIEAVRAADAAGEPLLVLGGGSNLVASDEPFPGTVVLLRDPEEPPLLDATCEVGASGEPDGIPVDPADLTPLDPTCGGAIVEYFAGVSWDRAVRYAIAR